LTPRGDAITFERLDLEQCDWRSMDAFHDRVVFQTREWLTFLERTQGGEPVVAAVHAGGSQVGYFTGMIVRRSGLRILGSPFAGWTTDWMGFNLRDGVSRVAVARALPSFAFGELGCIHLEVKDRRLPPDALPLRRFKPIDTRTFEVDLARTDDELLGAMTGACRRGIRKGERVGVRVEEAASEGFADEFYSQLIEVFARQSLRPTYGLDRVRNLVRCLHPAGHLLLLRALSPEGEPIATGIFPGMNGTGYFWGGASRRSHQILRPNEAIFWYAMRYWRDRGATALDTSGGGEYKRKYGVREVRVPTFARSRVPGLMLVRDVAAQVVSRQWLRRRPRTISVSPD
jgi:CelD/BcsL family acetyltransferase involved in cellulose biosynthesis